MLKKNGDHLLIYPILLIQKSMAKGTYPDVGKSTMKAFILGVRLHFVTFTQKMNK